MRIFGLGSGAAVSTDVYVCWQSVNLVMQRAAPIRIRSAAKNLLKEKRVLQTLRDKGVRYQDSGRMSSQTGYTN